MQKIDMNRTIHRELIQENKYDQITRDLIGIPCHSDNVDWTQTNQLEWWYFDETEETVKYIEMSAFYNKLVNSELSISPVTNRPIYNQTILCELEKTDVV